MIYHLFHRDLDTHCFSKMITLQIFFFSDFCIHFYLFVVISSLTPFQDRRQGRQLTSLTPHHLSIHLCNYLCVECTIVQKYSIQHNNISQNILCKKILHCKNINNIPSNPNKIKLNQINIFAFIFSRTVRSCHALMGRTVLIRKFFSFCFFLFNFV